MTPGTRRVTNPRARSLSFIITDIISAAAFQLCKDTPVRTRHIELYNSQTAVKPTIDTPEANIAW